MHGVGVDITSDQLIVGSRAVMTCFYDLGVADRIDLVSGVGQVVASATSVRQLSLTLDPVNDTLHGLEVTCFVTPSMYGGESNESVPNATLLIAVTGKWKCIILVGDYSTTIKHYCIRLKL